MKKFLLVLISALLIISLMSCEKKNEEETDKTGIDEIPLTDEVETVLNPMEYTLYQNIFYNDMAADYEGNSVTKEGIFTVIKDKFSNMDRYYVWGYSDNTLCCDWQWEFVPEDTSVLPVPGSKVKVSGTLNPSEDALDGHWYTGASVEVLSNYTNNEGMYDLTTMSPTLARVQLANLMNHIADVSGVQLSVYGRIQTGNKIQHPYYDNNWELNLDYNGELPAVGTYVTVKGELVGTAIEDAKISVNEVIIDE
ncbi:MAG: hypothetical protein IKU52_02640 [Clostridia bacterium]|nr:hypothetical protein [Clostridia bacterium]